MIDLRSMKCEECEASFFGEGHAEHNRKRVSHAKSVQVLGITPDWILAFRNRYGLTQGDAGRLFGGGKIAFSRYESGSVSPSQSLVRLLLVADKLPGAIDLLRRIASDEAEVTPLLSPQKLFDSWYFELSSSATYEGMLKMWSANQGDFDGADLEDAA